MTERAGHRPGKGNGARATHPEPTEASRARVIHHARSSVNIHARRERLLILVTCTVAAAYLAIHVLAAALDWRAAAGIVSAAAGGAALLAVGGDS